VQMVLDRRMPPKDLGPHLATENDVPQPELSLAGEQPSRLRRFWDRLTGE